MEEKFPMLLREELPLAGSLHLQVFREGEWRVLSTQKYAAVTDRRADMLNITDAAASLKAEQSRWQLHASHAFGSCPMRVIDLMDGRKF